jgi:hypothetical protein
VAQRWIVAVLRHRKFFHLADLNEAIAELLDGLNHRPFRKRPDVSRTLLYEQLDRPALKPLPAERYVLAYWKPVRPNIDYHVEIDRHYYSVPVPTGGAAIGCALHGDDGGNSIAADGSLPTFTATLPTPPPPSTNIGPRVIRAHLEWKPSRLINWAATVELSDVTRTRNTPSLIVDDDSDEWQFLPRG